jgi:hypothetical protein
LIATLGASSTTAPTSAPVDPSTPKGALKVFSRALDAGDRDIILQMLAADSEQDHKLASATADLAVATAQLRQAATKAFGDAKSRALGVDPGAQPAAMARIDAAAETIIDAAAVVRTADNEGPPMKLVKRDGKWRLPVAELSKDVEAADLDKNLADVAAQVGLTRVLADEVAAGKFATATDARQALDQRILKATMPQLMPGTTTASATRPAK